MVTSFLTMTTAYAVNCQSFSTQAEAQAYFNANHAKKLDRDHDGIACEHLPGGGSFKSTKTTRVSKKTTPKQKSKSTGNVTEANNPFAK